MLPACCTADSGCVPCVYCLQPRSYRSGMTGIRLPGSRMSPSLAQADAASFAQRPAPPNRSPASAATAGFYADAGATASPPPGVHRPWGRADFSAAGASQWDVHAPAPTAAAAAEGSGSPWLQDGPASAGAQAWVQGGVLGNDVQEQSDDGAGALQALQQQQV